MKTQKKTMRARRTTGTGTDSPTAGKVRKPTVAMVSRAAVLDAISTSWLDPMLTGPNSVLGPYPWGCPDVEKLFAALRKRIEAL